MAAEGLVRHADKASWWACLGLAAVLAADWCSRDLGMTLAQEPVLSISYYVDSILAVVAFLGLACLLRRSGGADSLPGFARPSVLVALGAVSVIGRLLRAFAAPLPLGGVLVCVGTAVASAAEAALLLVWLAVFVRHEATFVPLGIPGAYLVVCVVYFLLRGVGVVLGEVAVTLFVSVLPLLSGLAFVAWRGARPAGEVPYDPELMVAAGDEGYPASADEPDQAASADLASASEEEATGWGFPVYPVLLMAAYSFIFYFTLALSVGPNPYGSVGMAAVSLVACALAALRPAHRNEIGLYGAALPLMISGLLVLGYLHTGRGGAVLLTNAGNVAFTLFLLVSLARMCHRYAISPFWVFGVVEGTQLIVATAGRRLGGVFVEAYPVGSETCSITVAVAVVALVLLASLALLGGDRLFRSFGMQPVASHRVAQGSLPGVAAGADTGAIVAPSSVVQTTMTYSERIVWECAKVARLYGLTQREEEILELLVQGFSTHDIAEKSYITYGTAKTHIAHIYSKLGVHAREAAVALTRQVADQ